MSKYKFGLAWQTYIIRADATHLYKIGRTMNVPARLKELRILNADALTLIAHFPFNCEPELHLRFASSRHHGEWFSESPEFLNFLDTIRMTHVDGLRALLSL